MDKRAKLFNTRTIRTEIADPSYKDGILSVPDFINARKFEIKSFEMSQLKTRSSASNRVFQNLPRVMRRRTASHNVKRVPKRLRKRALREMQDTNQIRKKTTSKQIYKLTMSKKLLRLATKIKLMKSIPQDRKGNIKSRIHLLKEQIEDLKSQKNWIKKPKLNNTMGSYDNTGLNEFASKPTGHLKYSKRQREFVWLTTHIWHAKRAHLIKRWGYQIPLTPSQKCFKTTNRASKSGTILFDTSFFDTLIMDFNEEIVKSLISPSKAQIEGRKSYTGPLMINCVEVGQCLAYCSQSLKRFLLRVHPSIYEELFSYLRAKYPEVSIQDCRYSIGSIDLVGPTALRTLNKVFHPTKEIPEFKNMSRHNDDSRPGTTFSFSIKDPRLWNKPNDPPIKEELSYTDLIIRFANGSVDNDSFARFSSPEGRMASYNNQLTNKQLALHPKPEDIVETIPIFLTKTDISWTLLAPWFWILPIWLKLHQVNHVNLGGLNQMRQIRFENNLLSFEDYPYLPECWQNNELNIKLNLQKYNKLPLSKRQKEKFENGLLPFGNDWEFLQKLILIRKKLGVMLLPNEKKFGEFTDKLVKEIKTLNDLIDHINDARDFKLCVEKFNVDLKFHSDFVQNKVNFDNIEIHSLPKLPIKLIKFEVPEGTVEENSRIYLQNTDIQNLIGFVTSGGFNLSKGKCTGIGYITADVHPNEYSNLLVRDIGCSNAYKICIS